MAVSIAVAFGAALRSKLKTFVAGFGGRREVKVLIIRSC
jgi:hypothetical protein